MTGASSGGFGGGFVNADPGRAKPRSEVRTEAEDGHSKGYDCLVEF